MKKVKNINIIIITIILLLICFFFISKIYDQEKNNYKIYNDFTRANQVMMLTLNKNLAIQFGQIRSVQATNQDEKKTIGSLIYDFSKYNIIPILDYLYSESESPNLVQSFTFFTDFISYYTSAKMGLRENVLVKLNGNDFYTYKDNIYIYKVEKDIISKDTFHNLYGEYLKTKNFKNVEENFIYRLLKIDEIKRNENIISLKHNINNNYQEFYSKYETNILQVISDDLTDFNNYLNTFIQIDEDGNNPVVILKDIKTEKLSLFYNFKELDRIYSPVSKYYTHSYQLDIQNVWNQLKNIDYPKLFM